MQIMGTLCLCILFRLCTLTSSQVSFLDTPFFLNMVHKTRDWVIDTFARNLTRTYTGPSGKVQKEVPINVPFPCNVTGGRSAKVPDSIHRLRPGDIDVIAAMGDSLTGASGAFAVNFIETLVENRGVAGNIGGEGTWRKYLTLPNILKEYNPKLTGYAYGDSFVYEPASRLNVATIAAMSRDMPFMANYLVNKMRNDSKIDIKQHWKLVSIFIGHNDICNEMCVLPSPQSILDIHRYNLIKTLRLLRDKLPRTFVAIVSMPHLEIVNNAERGRFSFFIYLVKNVYCPCLFGLQYKNRSQEFFGMIGRLHKIQEEVAEYPEFHQNDFTVVVLPTAKHLDVPPDADGLTDLTYLSADRFHASQKAHALRKWPQSDANLTLSLRQSSPPKSRHRTGARNVWMLDISGARSERVNYYKSIIVHLIVCFMKSWTRSVEQFT